MTTLPLESLTRRRGEATVPRAGTAAFAALQVLCSCAAATVEDVARMGGLSPKTAKRALRYLVKADLVRPPEDSLYQVRPNRVNDARNRIDAEDTSFRRLERPIPEAQRVEVEALLRYYSPHLVSALR